MCLSPVRVCVCVSRVLEISNAVHLVCDISFVARRSVFLRVNVSLSGVSVCVRVCVCVCALARAGDLQCRASRL
jgi:hypothetical protein